MTTTTTARARVIRSSVPSPRVLRTINPLVSMILRSPIHWLLSSSTLLLTFTGRKTGKQFTIPVGYTRDGDTLTLFSSKSWWKNLRNDGRVVIYLQGHKRTARAELVEDCASLLDAAERLVAQYSFKEAGRRIGLALDTSPPPTSDELAAALVGRVAMRLILDP